jgi:tripartite-type tricarboxylate transporter receptor subunit TctC
LNENTNNNREGKMKKAFWQCTQVPALALVLTLSGGAAHAADYPDKPIRLTVPYEPGGPTDNSARVIQPKVGAALGQQIVIENRPGAGSVIGSNFVAKSKPDGYNILLFTATNTMNPSFVQNLPYDMIKDFAPITMLAKLPSIVVVNPDLPVKSVQELVAYAKSNPGKLRYVSAGTGTPMHLAGELLKSMAKLDIIHVPYKGSAPAFNDLVAGRVEMGIIGASPGLIGLIESGKLRALATAGETRSALFPDLPTVSEAGLPGFFAEGWHGLAAPAGTPKEVVDRLYKEVSAVLRDPETKALMKRDGAEPGGMPPDAFAEILKSEIDKWGKVVRDNNIKTE